MRSVPGLGFGSARRGVISRALALCLALAGCGGEPPHSPGEVSTWEIIRDDILAANCASCHAAGTSFARQSGLVLTPDVAWEQLFNRVPSNQAAAADNLLLVSDQGLAGLYRSFLWEKINAPNEAHFYADHPFYGALMPPGGKPLTNGEIEFIRRWIVAGAPREGAVADPALLEDGERWEALPFAPLPPPARGIQLHLGPFDVPTGYEREFFSYEPIDRAEDIFISRIEIAASEGSHHFGLYTLRENILPEAFPEPFVYRDIRDRGGYIPLNMVTMPYHVPIAISQWPRVDLHFPPGAALRLPAGEGLDLDSHYTASSTEGAKGEIYINLHTLDPAEVEREVDIFSLSNSDISLPPKQVTTLVDERIFDERRLVFQMFSHAHQHMVEFRAEMIGGPRDGELVYVSYDWEHPPILRLDTPLVIEAGQGLRLSATYDNQTDRELGYGLLSEDEMMIFYGYYTTE